MLSWKVLSLTKPKARYIKRNPSTIILQWYNYTYTYTCGNIINNNDERIHFFRKTYLSHFILERVAKGLCVRGELETEQTAAYWPQVPLTIAALLSRSAGLLNRGSLRAASPQSGVGSQYPELQFRTSTATDSNWLKLSVAPGYIIVWLPPASCGRRNCTEFKPSTG